MAENPLLPHRRLRDLYKLMRRVHSSLYIGPKPAHGLEAIVAAALIQLEPDDAFCAQSGASALAQYASTPLKQCAGGQLLTSALQDPDLCRMSSLIAFGYQATEQKNVVLSMTSTSTVVDWPSIFKQAQRKRLPMVSLLVETSGPTRNRDLLPWSKLAKYAKAAGVPTISVDGEDAVALYRVVQESLHRARLGDGPTVVWCAVPVGRPGRGGSRAIASMENYLGDRGLLRPARKRVTKP